MDKPARWLQAAVEVDGTEDGFEYVPEDRCAFAAARKVLFSAEIQEVANSNFSALLGQDGFADEE